LATTDFKGLSMTSNQKPVQVGDTLYLIKLWSNEGSKKLTPHEVEKVGRKWITVSGGIQIDKETMKGDMVDAYYSEAEYENVLRIQRLKRRIVKALDTYGSSSPVTAAQIEAIGEILGINGDLTV
jgi:hypothetical protein